MRDSGSRDSSSNLLRAINYPFSNENHFVIFIIYARIPKSGLIGGLYENASGIFIFYACGPQRNQVIFFNGYCRSAMIFHYPMSFHIWDRFDVEFNPPS